MKNKRFSRLLSSELSGGTCEILDFCKMNDLDIPDWLTVQTDDWPRFMGTLHLTEESEKRWAKNPVYCPMGHRGAIFIYIVEELQGKWWWVCSPSYSMHVNFELEEDALAFKLWCPLDE